MPTKRYIEVIIKTPPEEDEHHQQEETTSSPTTPTTVAADQPCCPTSEDFLYEESHRERQLGKSSASDNCTDQPCYPTSKDFLYEKDDHRHQHLEKISRAPYNCADRPYYPANEDFYRDLLLLEKSSAPYNCTTRTFTPNTPPLARAGGRDQLPPSFWNNYSAGADNTTAHPRHPVSYGGGDIKTTLERKNHAWQLPSYAAGHRSSKRIAPVTTSSTSIAAVSPSAVAIARRVLEYQEEYKQLDSYFPNNTTAGASRRNDHAPSSREFITTSSKERPSRNFPVFPTKECWGNTSPRPPSNTSIATTSTSTTSASGGTLLDHSKSNISNIPIATQSNLIAKNIATSSVIPCDDKIFDKQPTQQLNQQQQHPQQQEVFSKYYNPNISYEDNALLDNLTCVVPHIWSRKCVTAFTYAVMCQFVKASFIESDMKGNRTKIHNNGNRTKTAIGHKGLKCKHCGGYGTSRMTGRYFPTSLKTFADTTKSLMPMHRHLILCPECPDDLKSLITRLHDCHELELQIKKSRRNKRENSQISFYRQIWKALHPDASTKT